MTRYNLPLADDPSSIESLLRTRKSQLAAERRVERATATAEHDADELLRLMRTMPPDLRLTVAEGEALTDREYRYLRAHHSGVVDRRSRYPSPGCTTTPSFPPLRATRPGPLRPRSSLSPSSSESTNAEAAGR